MILQIIRIQATSNCNNYGNEKAKKKKYFALYKEKQQITLNERCSTDVLYLNWI